jgi:hypothetical protein
VGAGGADATRAEGILHAVESLPKSEVSMSELPIPVSAEDHIQGEPQAECSLVEWGDYECPSCCEAYPIVQKLQKQFGYRLSFVFRNFPLARYIHGLSQPLKPSSFLPLTQIPGNARSVIRKSGESTRSSLDEIS